MFGNCENCPAKDWLCEYYCFKSECEKRLKSMGVPKEALDDGKVHSGIAETWIVPTKIDNTKHQLSAKGFLGADEYLEHKKRVMEVAFGLQNLGTNEAIDLLKYFLTVKREFCACVVDAFCNKTDDKCDKCKEYDQMVEKAKKLLEEKK